MAFRLGLVAFWVLLFWPVVGSGGLTVAVMPVEDLSQGANGYSPTMTADISAILRERGMRVVPEAEVMNFMVTGRIRWLGYLDVQQLAKAKEKMGADIVVLATVNQRREANLPVLGLTVQMLRTNDGRVAWAGGSELCRADVRRLLGLAEPKTIEDVEKIVVRQAMANLPENVALHAEIDLSRQVDSVRLSSNVLRPGESVACRIRFSGLEGPKSEDVVVLVGNKEVPVSFREREHYYEAVWPAEQAAAGEVAVRLRVGGGREGDEQEIFVGTYLVDDLPPKVTLQASGPQLNGRLVFRDQVSFVPVLVDPKPIKRWRLEVVDRDGRIILSGDGDGLPDRFMWYGQNNQGGMAGDGVYSIVLNVWDRAENNASTTSDVEVIRRPPPVEVVFQGQPEGVAVNLGYADRVPLAHWRAQFTGATGDLMQENSGETLPARLLVPKEIVGETKVRLVFFAQDILGNQVKKVIQDIGGQAATADVPGAAEQAPAAGWVEDF